MREALERDGVALRRAETEDADAISALASDENVEPFLAAARARDREAILVEIERSRADPMSRGLFVIESTSEARAPIGAVAFEVSNRRSRIAHLYGLMLEPGFRGRGLATAATRLFTEHLLRDLGFHRVELECYGFNERAIRHFERAGFVREGVKRKAYWRRGEWVDGVLFAIVREDLEGEEAATLP